MSSLSKITDPPYVWRTAPSERETVRDLLPVLRDLNADNPSCTVIKESPCNSIYQLPSNRPGTETYARLYRRDDWHYWLRNPPGTREGRIMRRLRRVGVPVADFVAVGTKRILPFEIENTLVIRSPARLMTLGRWSYDQFQEHGAEARKRVSPLLARVLAAVRRMHEAGICHGDMNPGNVLVDPEGRQFILVDFHRSQAVWPQPFRRRAWDVCKALTFFDKYYETSGLYDLISAYSSGSLARKIREHRGEIVQRIRAHQASSILEQCFSSQTYFRNTETANDTVFSDRQYEIAEIQRWTSERNGPGNWSTEEISGTAQEARDRWHDAVRQAIYEERPGCPVALVCRSGSENKHSLIWDLSGNPEYVLSHTFSLERFASGEKDTSPLGEHTDA